jgi:addiction module HigA family antidote
MTAPAIQPGEHLAEELKTLDMSAAGLARKLHVPTNRITQILNGQRAITGDTALRLAHFFGTSPEFRLNLESLYELRLARQKAGKAIKGLLKLKRTEPVRQKTYDLRKLLKAITAKNQPNAADFGPPQGKEVC